MMFIRNRALISTAALSGAAAIIATSTAVVAGGALGGAGARPLPRLSAANVELTAITDITIQGINDAFWSGWGGYIGPANTQPDPYYPNINPTGTSPVYVSGASGVVYYLVDQALDTFAPGVNLDNYFFEVGSYYGAGKNAAGSGASALIYVGASEAFGASSPIARMAKAIFYYGTPALINATVVQVAGLLPTVNIGPVKIGGGILASLYFTGQTPDGSMSFGTAGLSAIGGYIATSIADRLPKPIAPPKTIARQPKELSGATVSQPGVGDARSAATVTARSGPSPETPMPASAGTATPASAGTDTQKNDSAISAPSTPNTKDGQPDTSTTATTPSTPHTAKSGLRSVTLPSTNPRITSTNPTESTTAVDNSSGETSSKSTVPNRTEHKPPVRDANRSTGTAKGSATATTTGHAHDAKN
jgi:hypothetical protein